MLEPLYVDNDRCLVNFECHLAAKQRMVGPNGTGKSTLFDVLSLLRDFCVRGLPAEDVLADATRTRWQSVPEQSFELDVAITTGQRPVAQRIHLEDLPQGAVIPSYYGVALGVGAGLQAAVGPDIGRAVAQGITAAGWQAGRLVVDPAGLLGRRKKRSDTIFLH